MHLEYPVSPSSLSSPSSSSSSNQNQHKIISITNLPLTNKPHYQNQEQEIKMANNPPVKSLSFDLRGHDDKNKADDNIGKSFSFASRTHSDFNTDSPKPDHHNLTDIAEENDDIDDNDDDTAQTDDQHKEISLDQLSEEIDNYIVSLSSNNDVEISNVVSLFLKKLESKMEDYESSHDDSVAFGRNADEDSLFISAVARIPRLMVALNGITSNKGSTMPLINQASSVLHRAMVFLEEELRYLLEEPACLDSGSKHADSSKHDYCVLPDRKSAGGDQGENNNEETTPPPPSFPYFSPEAVTKINLISNAMIVCGYEAECGNVFMITRRHAFEEELKRQGFEKISVDDVQKMNWETLEGEIAKWIQIFKYCSNDLFPGEHKFFQSVFSDHPSTGHHLFSSLSSAVFSLLVNFAEAVSMTKRSTEKLFKFLDMYETLRDMNLSVVNNNNNDKSTNTNIYKEECGEELRSELSFAGSRLGEAAVSIFCQLENSIKSDNAKTPVPSGAVHPLTRYTMNYLKYACEYKDTLEQVFQQHLKTEQSEEYSESETKPDSSSNSRGAEAKGGDHNQNYNKEKASPFGSQLMIVMELLDKNLEAKSKLYKDPSLRFIFLMNNGRYMLQKVKGSAEIHQVVGDNWCRKRSSDVRHYHKSYQRETWSRVLQCLNQEGLQVNGKVQKPVLKERFKNFNQLFDEIHKTQSTWVVSDEQLQSELRVSISAVMIPAYRSFVARFGQIFTPGRQTEKYIKYQPDDIEGVIEELFDGNQNLSMARRKT